MENTMANSLPVTFKPIGVTDVSVRRILERGNCDALGLYVAYFEISEWQGTHRVYATESFMRKRLNLGQVRFRRAKKILEELNLTKLIHGGRNHKTYVEILHLVDSSVINELPKTLNTTINNSVENNSVENDPQVLSTITKVLSSESKVLDVVKERFDLIRTKHKRILKGKARGLETEWSNFIKKNPKPTLSLIETMTLGAKNYYKSESKKPEADNPFRYTQNFSTWINQKSWEMYLPDNNK